MMMMMIKKHLKTTIVSVTVETVGMVKKGTDKNINTIPGSPKLNEIQKITLYRMVHLL